MTDVVARGMASNALSRRIYPYSGMQIPVVLLYTEDPTTVIQTALRRGYTFIFISELIAALNGQGTLPTKPIILTYDNGYMELYTVAHPVIQNYGIKCNVAIISNMQSTPQGTLYSVSSPTDYAGWANLQKMAATGLYEFHNHTQTHNNLATITSAQRIAEFQNCYNAMVQYLGAHVPPPSLQSLIYPNGNYDSATLQDVKNFGFGVAFDYMAGANTCGSTRPSLIGDNPYHFNRVYDSTPNALLWCYDDVIYDFCNDCLGGRNYNNALNYWTFSSSNATFDLNGIALRLTGTPGTAQTATTTDYFRVNPNDTIYTRFKGWSQSQTTGNQTIQILQYDQNKNPLSPIVLVNYTTDSGGYANYEIESTLASNCHFVQLQLKTDTNANGYLHFYAGMMRRKS